MELRLCDLFLEASLSLFELYYRSSTNALSRQPPAPPNPVLPVAAGSGEGSGFETRFFRFPDALPTHHARSTATSGAQFGHPGSFGEHAAERGTSPYV